MIRENNVFLRIRRVSSDTSHPSRHDSVVLISASSRMLSTKITTPITDAPLRAIWSMPAAPMMITATSRFRRYTAPSRLPRIADGGIGMESSNSLSFASKIAPWA